MSKETIVAKRYAKALFSTAKDQGQIAEVERDLIDVVQHVWVLDDFKKIIEHPSIEMKAKQALLQSALEGNISDITYRTIRLMVARHRGQLLPALLDYYSNIADEEMNRVKAIVYAPNPLSAADVTKLKDTFGKRLGKTIVLETIVTPSLLGGLRVRIGDSLYDGSLSSKLADLQKSLAM